MRILLLVGALLAGCGDKEGEPEGPASPEETAEPAGGDSAETDEPAGDSGDSGETIVDTGAPGPVDADGDGIPAGEDCDDADPARGGEEVPYTGIDEDCDPATPDDDADGDGYGAAADCDDADPARSPGATEACGGGADMDCDGLLACEDGDCAGEAPCGEDCGAAGDEEGDGLADCADDDCWGSEACFAGASARVVGGERRGERWIHDSDDSRYRSMSWAGTHDNWSTSANTVRSAVGVLTLPEMGATCSWGVSEAAWERSYFRRETWLDSYGELLIENYSRPLTRKGFWISGACPVQTSAFLDWYGTNHGVFRATYGERYRGGEAVNVLTQTSARLTTTFYTSAGGSPMKRINRERSRYTHETFTIGEISGETFFHD